MANFFGKDRDTDFAASKLMSFGKSFSRMNGQPLDESEVWYNKADLEAFAAGNSAYVGMKLVYVDEAEQKVYHYSVQYDGTIKEIGVSPIGDDKSIELVDEKISLHDFGKVFYKYIAEVKDEEGNVTEEAHYEKTEVSDENPWKAGLEPKVVTEDGQLVIGWYEPNPTTIEGVNDQVTAVQGTIADLSAVVGTEATDDAEATGIFADIADTNATVAGLADDIEAVTEEIGKKAEGETAATGIYAAIATAKQEAIDAAVEAATYDDTKVKEDILTNANAISTNATAISELEGKIATDLENYYDKTEVDGKVEDLQNQITAIPKFAIKVVTELPTEDISNTTVYLVADDDESTNDLYNEYIYVDDTWELLGKASLDLSAYAKTADVTTLTDALDERLDAAETDVSDLKTAVGKIDVAGDIAAALEDYTNTTDMSAAIDAAKGEAIADAEGKIATVQEAVDANAEAINSINAAGYITDEALVDYAKSEDVAQDIADAIATHNEDKEHLTTEEVEGKIDAAKRATIDAVLIKSVNETEFKVDEAGNLTAGVISADKISGIANTYATIASVDSKIGNVPVYSEPDENGDKTVVTPASGIYSNVYTKEEVADLIADITGGESAADVLASLNTYKGTNDARVLAVETDVVALQGLVGNATTADDSATGLFANVEAIEAKLADIEEGAQANVIEKVLVNGTELTITDKSVDIPLASASVAGAVILGSEFQTNATSNALEVKELNVNKLVQTEGEYLELNGGSATGFDA